jgi:hypothetical protein
VLTATSTVVPKALEHLSERFFGCQVHVHNLEAMSGNLEVG